MLWLCLLFALFPVTISYDSAKWNPFGVIDRASSISNVSPQCVNDTNTWMNSLLLFSEATTKCMVDSKDCSKKDKQIISENMYAVKQLDAFGRFPPPDLLDLTLVFDGSYRECQSVSGVKYDTNYCYLILTPGKNSSCIVDPNNVVSITFRMRSAVCMPYSCSEQDLPKLFNDISPLPFTACEAFCTKKEIEKDSAFWGFTIFLAVVVAIALLSTVFDYIRDTVYEIPSHKEKNLLFRILLTFSFWTNAGLLLSVKEQKPGFIKSLDCIRFFSMSWVVAGHSILMFLYNDSLGVLTKLPNNPWNHIFTNALLSVDTFFLLSGIVVAYLFFKERPKSRVIKSPITWILFYVHRYLRLTPPIMIFIGFFVVYAPYIQGPFVASGYDNIQPQVQGCIDTWWKNLLYINNFDDADEACYGITWYLAVDTQLYVVVPIFLIALYYSFAIGTLVILAGCVGSIVTTYILFFVYDLPANPLGNDPNGKFMPIMYEKPWTRCTPYLVGVFAGYFLARYGKRPIRLNFGITILCWLVAFGVALAAVFGDYDYDKGSNWSIFTRATYYNFSRLGWAVAVAWVIVANHMGWGGPINNFMSHPIWQPFGRLSYCAYIVHWVVITYYFNLSDRPIHFVSMYEIYMYYAIAITLISYFVAFFWSSLFEVPILKLEKMLIEAIIGGGSEKTETTENKRKGSYQIEEEKPTSWTSQTVSPVQQTQDTAVLNTTIVTEDSGSMKL